MVKRIPNCQVIPAWYGVAWRCWMSNTNVCLPMPLNVFARIARAIYVWARYGAIDVRADAREAYAQGRRDGDKA